MTVLTENSINGYNKEKTKKMTKKEEEKEKKKEKKREEEEEIEEENEEEEEEYCKRKSSLPTQTTTEQIATTTQLYKLNWRVKMAAVNTNETDIYMRCSIQCRWAI